MIKFIDKEGILFNGVSPYVHWVEGQQSTNIIYPMKLMVISDSAALTIELPENDVFKLVDITRFDPSIDPEKPEDITKQTLDYITHDDEGNAITKLSFGGYEYDSYYLYQIHIIATTPTPGQITEHFKLTAGADECDCIVGGDFYDLNEILSINLENRGLELPVTIQKAIFESDLHNDIVDNILINRKFKELISNYLDIVDNKGSYLSLYNSLQWFEWGDYAKLYEIWDTGNKHFLEKDMELTLGDLYQSLLSSARKTTHISLVAPLDQNVELTEKESQTMSHDEKIEKLLDDDKNPKIIPIPNQWTRDDLYLKVAVLGAFYERYFMPIHLDLKRATAEALVYTPWVNMANGTLYRTSDFMYDTGIVNIEMEHIVTLGNIDGYGVGPYTMFGVKDMDKISKVGPSNIPGYISHIDPVGVEPLSTLSSTLPAAMEGLIWDKPGEPEETESILEWNIDSQNPEDNISWEGSDTKYDEHDDIRVTFSQFGGNVGVIVPIKVYFDLPKDDAISRAELYVYRGYVDSKDKIHMPSLPTQHVIEKGIWKPEQVKIIDENGDEQLLDKYQVHLDFNLLSLKEEMVSFTMVFYSLSGHVWTACSSYRSIDVSGSYLNVYRVSNTDNSIGSLTKLYNTTREWIKGKPYGIQYNTIELDIPEGEERWESQNITSIYGNLEQYIPTNNYEQLNEMFLVKNNGSTVDESLIYDTDWIYNYTDNAGLNIDNHFWVFPRGSVDSYDRNQYYVIISKKPGQVFGSKQVFINYIYETFKQNGQGLSININSIQRHDYIFLPQLHQYTNIEDIPMSKDTQITPDKRLTNTGKYIPTEKDYIVESGTLLSVIPQFKRTVLMDKDSIKWIFTNVSKPGTEIVYKQPVSTIMIADNMYKDMDPGYWTITMCYRMVGEPEGVEHRLTKNSAFKIVENAEENIAKTQKTLVLNY